MENLSKSISKTKRKKKTKTNEEIGFHNSIQDWVLLPFTSYGKVLGKVPAI